MVPLFYNLNNEKHPLNHEDIHFLHPRQSTRGSQPKQWSTWMCTMKSWGGGGGIGTSLEKKKETKKSWTLSVKIGNKVWTEGEKINFFKNKEHTLDKKLSNENWTTLLPVSKYTLYANLQDINPRKEKKTYLTSTTLPGPSLPLDLPFLNFCSLLMLCGEWMMCEA